MNFWAAKLNNEAVPVVIPPSRNDYGLYPQSVPLPQAVSFNSPSIRPVKGEGVCPGCGSNNYREPIGNFAVSCPDCGYHPRFEQSGYGAPTLRTPAGAAKASRQVSGGQTMGQAMAVLNAGGGEHIETL